MVDEIWRDPERPDLEQRSIAQESLRTEHETCGRKEGRLRQDPGARLAYVDRQIGSRKPQESVVGVRVRNHAAEQARTSVGEPLHLGERDRLIRVGVERQAEVEQQARAAGLELYAAATDLPGAAVDADPRPTAPAAAAVGAARAGSRAAA